jgi:hypothetical protein
MHPELEILRAHGAEVVGGDVQLDREIVGMLRNGQFILTPEGREAIDKRGAPKAAAKAAPAEPKARGRKAKPVAEPTPEPEVEQAAEPGDILAGLDDDLEGLGDE